MNDTNNTLAVIAVIIAMLTGCAGGAETRKSTNDEEVVVEGVDANGLLNTKRSTRVLVPSDCAGTGVGRNDVRLGVTVQIRRDDHPTPYSTGRNDLLSTESS